MLKRAVASPPGTWLYLHVFPHIDRPLLRLSRGRLSIAVGQPVLLLETVGARSGLRRETPLVYTASGEDVVLVASNGGRPGHPAWYHNLRAHPEAELTLRGRRGRYRAREAEGEERQKLWDRALEVYPGYDTYQRRTGGRRIPVMVLSPVDPAP